MIEQAPGIGMDDINVALMVELQTNGSLQKIQDDYLYWDKVKYRAKGCTPEELWKVTKLFRRLQASYLRFGRYRFSYVITDYIQRSLHGFDLNIGGTLGSNIGIAETDKTKFMISSIMEEAISSSQMEGASTTRKKAREMIQLEKRPRDKSEQMILNNFITMKHIVRHKDDNLTPEGILYIHQLISRNTLDESEEEGRFRKNDDVYVVNHTSSDIAHIPPEEKELPDLISDLCAFFNSDQGNFIHPIIKGCVIHFMIGWIHPFTDGNGRTARALFYWYMLKKGYWLTEYLSISRIIQDSKSQYERAYLYSESDENDLSYFITYHLKTMEKAFEALKEHIHRKQKEVFQAAGFMKIPGVNDRMAQILKVLHDDPERVLSIKEIESRFQVSNFTARSDLKSLVDLGFLNAIPANKKKLNFVRSAGFEEKINKID